MNDRSTPLSPDTLYRQVFASSRDGIFIIDLQGRYVDANPAATALVGYSLDELRQMTVDDLLFPGDGLPPEERQRAWQEGRIVRRNLRHKDGHAVPVELNMTPLNLPQMEPLVMGLARDISEPLKLQQALRLSEEKFSKAFQLAPLLMSITRLADGHFIEANENFIKAIGYTREEVIGHTSAEINLFVDPNDRQRLVSQLQSQGFVEQMQTRVNTRSGDIRHMLISARPLLIQQTPCILIVGMDITEKIQAEQALQQSEEKFRLAFEYSPDSINITRLSDGKIIAVNNAFPQITGYSREEAIGRKATDLALWANPDDRQIMVTTLREKGYIRDFEFVRKRKDGKELYTSLSAAVINIDGEPHLLSIIRDIDEQKRLSAELQAYREHLEELVAERTADIEKLNRGMLAMLEDLKEANERNERLLQELEAANAELKTFTYSVSHDLKAPLRGIDGYSHLLLEDYHDRLDEEGRFFLTNIRQAVERMAQLIDDLLAYSRMERRSLTPRTFSLPDLIDQLISERRAELAAAGVELSRQITCDTITADYDGLVMALRNLIDNAVKFSAGATPPRITIGAQEQADRILIWVQDNGIGFDPQFQDRIFEIFQRLHSSEEIPGTGVGLAIVRKAMQRMGGRAWAESAPGQGATFYLELPHA